MSEKTCRKCGKTKLHQEFYGDRANTDGRRNSCIECDKARKRTPEVLEQSRRYYHSEKGKAAEQRYIETGKKRAADKARAQRPEVKEKTKERQPEYSRRYHQSSKGRESIRRNHNCERYQHWKRQHHSRPEIRERMRAYARIKGQERHARKRQLLATFTAENWQRAKEFFQHCCVYCGQEKPLAQDHFVPIASGGHYTPDNIVPVCKQCNSAKCNRDPKKWCSPETYTRIQEYFEIIKRSY